MIRVPKRGGGHKSWHVFVSKLLREDVLLPLSATCAAWSFQNGSTYSKETKDLWKHLLLGFIEVGRGSF